MVHSVDLATGVCTPLPCPLLFFNGDSYPVTRLPDGCLVCTGRDHYIENVHLSYDPESPHVASWQWRVLPAMSVVRGGCGACVLRDGRFAVFSGWLGLPHVYELIVV
jgi:hypothetical protein